MPFQTDRANTILRRQKKESGHSRIPDIIGRVGCTKHEAEKGEPCWTVRAGSRPFGPLPMICNRRAERAGFIIPTVEQLQERRRQVKNRG
jgi:hypothetical protein